MKLILIRHAETIANLKEINEGHTGGELTERGKRQAKKAGERLKDEKIDKIYVSDLKRAIDTAAEIIKHHPNAEVIYEPMIREQNQGIHEQSPYGTVTRAAKERGLTRLEYRPEGGESLNDLKLRLKKFLARIFKEDPDKTILLVTHGGIIINTLVQLFNIPDEDYVAFLPPNTAITIIELDFKTKHNIQLLNCVKHLIYNVGPK